MTKQIINVGSAEQAGDGESVRTAFIKINENFTELYDTNTGGNNALVTVSVTGGVAAPDAERTGATVLDLTKQIHKLSDGDYKIADGVEGQLIYLVQQTGSTANLINVYFDNGRVTGTTYANILFNPFNTYVGICMLMFTDGAWQSDGGLWD